MDLLLLPACAELFHASVGTAYADLRIDGQRETWRSRRFRAFRRRSYHETTRAAASAVPTKVALNPLKARTRFDAPERAVHLRVAEFSKRIYLALADDDWRAVEVAPGGWRILDNPPVRFRRPPGLLPLPKRGASLDALRRPSICQARTTSRSCLSSLTK